MRKRDIAGNTDDPGGQRNTRGSIWQPLVEDDKDLLDEILEDFVAYSAVSQ